MKSSPYGEKRSGEMDMKPRMSKNYEMSGMKNADGSPVKPGAPGMFGRIAKGVLTGGMSELFRKKKGGQAKTDALAAAAPGAAAPGAVAPGAAGAAGAAVPADEQAGPVAPPAGVAPADPTLAAAPVQMKGSPAKDIKSWTAKEMSGTGWLDKDSHNKKHRNKVVDENHKPIKKDKKAKNK